MERRFEKREIDRATLRHVLALGASVIAALGIVGCGAPADDEGAPEEEVESNEEGICANGCQEPTGLPLCSSTCTNVSDCSKPCEGADGSPTTCGGANKCKSCLYACTSSAACSTTCKSGTSITSCGNYGTCKKYDVYCAYPVLTEAAIWDNNELGNGLGGPFTDAYMYFASSSTAPKSGNYPSEIGGKHFDPTMAWASNFRGPEAITGESSRTQWEWYDGAPGGYDAEYFSPGPGFSAGAPYIYGKECRAVTAGSAAPTLTAKSEHVYEDDECLDLGLGEVCNADDWVGQFTIDRGYCNSEVFGDGQNNQWTEEHAAQVTSDLRYVRYKLWCYSCKSSWTNSCSNGTVKL
jgi:hypothetical protein